MFHSVEVGEIAFLTDLRHLQPDANSRENNVCPHPKLMFIFVAASGMMRLSLLAASVVPSLQVRVE